MKMRVACPHCQVVGVVPENLKHASDWPVACHHCHQHYFLPVVNTPAPLSRQIELYCSNCGRAAALNENIHKSIVASHFPLFCPDCHHPLPAQENITVDLNQTEIVDIGRQKSVGVRSGLIFIFIGFFIVSASVMAANEGLIGRDWLDNFLLHLPDRAVVYNNLGELLEFSLRNVQ